MFAAEETDVGIYESKGMEKIVLTDDEVVYYEIEEEDVTTICTCVI